MHLKQDKPANATEAFKFFSWAYRNGGKSATDLDYVPMPANVIAAIEKAWSQVTDASGKPVAFK
jgi:phosphate transport system substrate-binding protein